MTANTAAANNNATTSTRKAARRAPIVVLDITARDRVLHGRTIPGDVRKGHHAVIVAGESIRLHGDRYGKPYARTFRLGDVAEYDSFNLSYTGEIVSITASTIGILPRRGGKVHRLSLHEFSWRNEDFDADAIARRNARAMESI